MPQNSQKSNFYASEEKRARVKEFQPRGRV